MFQAAGPKIARHSETATPLCDQVVIEARGLISFPIWTRLVGRRMRNSRFVSVSHSRPAKSPAQAQLQAPGSQEPVRARGYLHKSRAASLSLLDCSCVDPTSRSLCRQTPSLAGSRRADDEDKAHLISPKAPR